MQHGECEAENCVVCFMVREKLVQQFRNVSQRDRTSVADFRCQRRFQHFAGIQPNQFLSLPHVIKCAHVSQRFERAAKSSFRLFS